MISDAQFLQWLKSEPEGYTVVALANFGYESAGAAAVGTLRLSSRPYLPASGLAYFDVISGGGFGRAISLEKLGGQGMQSVSDLVLDNADGRCDFVVTLILDGYDIKFYIGDSDWDFTDFRLVNVSSMVNAESTEMQVAVKLRAKTFLLDDTIIGDTIATGPNAGASKPLIVGGFCRQVDLSPYLFDTANQVYYISGNAALTSAGVGNGTTTIPFVRDNGVGLGPDTSYLSFDNTTMTANAATDTLTNTVAHGLSADDVIQFRGTGGGAHTLFTGLAALTQYWVLSSGLTANNFKVSLTRGGAAVDITGTTLTDFWVIDRARYYVDSAAGTLQLSSTPAGRVTADLSATGGDIATNNLHGAFLFLIKNFTQVTAADIDTASFAALTTLEALESVRYGRAILERANVRDLLDEIATASRSWYAWDSDGILKVGRLALESLDSATPIASLIADNILGKLTVKALPLRMGRVIVDWHRNWSAQPDSLAASVSQSNRAIWGLKFQKRTTSTDPGGTTYVANWWDYDRSAIDSKPIELNCVSGTGAGQIIADGLMALFRPWTCAFSCTVGIEWYDLNPGDCISLSYPRYGLDDGKKVRVISVSVNPLNRTVDLVMVRQETPDYTTSEYH